MSADTSAKCSACEEDCRLTFQCHQCGVTKQVCSSLPGGFTSSASNVCVTCYEEEQIDPTVLHTIRRHEYYQKNYARKNHAQP